MKPRHRQYFIPVCVYLGQFMFGFGAGWPTSVIPKLTQDNIKFQDVTPDNINYIVASVSIGCLIGTTSLGYLANVIGRKPCLIISGVITAVAYIALALARSASWLIAFRLIEGIGISAIYALNLVYIGEIASKEIRGMLLGGTSIFTALGLMTIYSVGPFVTYEIIHIIGLAACIIYIGAMTFVPETPVFLLLKGKDEAAKIILLAVGRKEDVEKITELKQEIEIINKSPGWKRLFSEKNNRKALCTTFLLYTFQQCSGLVPILNYGIPILESAGSSITPYIATIIVSIAQLLAAVIVPLFVERKGRKFGLLWSTAFSCLGLTVLATYTYLNDAGDPIVEKLKWLPSTMIIAYVFAYSLGLGVIPSVLTGEMFELNVRSAGSAVVLGWNFLSSFFLTVAFGYTDNVVAFYGYSVSCGLAFLFTVFFVPETKGKSLIDVQKMLA